MKRSLASGLLTVLFASLLLVPQSASNAAAPELRLLVNFQQPSGLPASKDAMDATTSLTALAATLPTANDYRNWFAGCVYGGKTACPTSPDVLIVTSVGQLNTTTSSYPITMRAYFLKSNETPTVFQFNVTKGGLAKAFDAFTDQQLQQLLGNPVPSNGSLTLETYDPVLQIVPDTAEDRQYFHVINDALNHQLIRNQLSEYTGITDPGAVPQAGAVTESTACLNSPRYLHYWVTAAKSPRILLGTTRIDVKSTAEIIDCGNPLSKLTASFNWAFAIPTTGLTLPKVLTLLSVAFISKTNSWTNAANFGTSASSLVDISTSDDTLTDHIYDVALINLTTKLCKTFQQNAEAAANQVVDKAVVDAQKAAADAAQQAKLAEAAASAAAASRTGAEQAAARAKASQAAAAAAAARVEQLEAGRAPAHPPGAVAYGVELAAAEAAVPVPPVAAANQSLATSGGAIPVPPPPLLCRDFPYPKTPPN